MFLRRLINVLSNIDNIITLRITLAFAEWRFCDSLAAAGLPYRPYRAER